MSEANKALYRRMTAEVWNKGNLDVVDELAAADVVIHGAPNGLPSGSQGIKTMVSMYRSAFPDLQVVSSNLVAEGDKVADYWTIRGTHKGELMGIPASGKQVESYGLSMARFEGGKVVEIWSASDQLSLMQQLGAIPS